MGELRPAPHGRGLILYGSRGGPGHPSSGSGIGRPPDAFKSFLRDALADPAADEMLAKVLRGESFIHRGVLVLVDGDLWAKTYAWATERVYGKLAPEAAATGDRKPLTIRLVHEVRSA